MTTDVVSRWITSGRDCEPSKKNTPPTPSAATDDGRYSRASVAGPPSPINEMLGRNGASDRPGVPAIVRMMYPDNACSGDSGETVCVGVGVQLGDSDAVGVQLGDCDAVGVQLGDWEAVGDWEGVGREIKTSASPTPRADNHCRSVGPETCGRGQARAADQLEVTCGLPRVASATGTSCGGRLPAFAVAEAQSAPPRRA